MPDYTTPRDWSDFAIVRAPYLNTDVRDNMLFFKTPPFNSVMLPAIVQTTSTSFVEVTGCSISVTSTGGNMFIAACGVSSNSTLGATNTFDLAIDGVKQGHATTGLTSSRSVAANYADNTNVLFCTTTPPSAGAHTYSLHWRCSSGTIDGMFRLFAIEVLGTHVAQTWTAPKTWTDEEFVDAAELNTHVRDNQEWLRNRPYADITLGAVTTTSTSFVELTGSEISVTSTGGRMVIFANCATANNTNGQNTFLDLAIDGTRVGNATNGLAVITSPLANHTDSMGIVWFTDTPPSAGAHDYTIWWKVSAGQAAADRPRLYCFEIA
jgi:hypothetical protein